MSDDEFRHQSVQDQRSIIKYLQAITAGIEKGSIQLGAADKLMELHPAGLLELDVRARREGGRNRLAVILHWRDHEADDAAPALTITPE